MSETLLKLAAQFLRDYSDRLSNDGCNDWEWPEGITASEKKQLVGAEWAKEWGTKQPPPNWLAASQLADLLDKQSEVPA